MSVFTNDLEYQLAGLDRDVAALIARVGGSRPIHLPEPSDLSFRPAIGYVPSTDADRAALLAEMGTFTALADAAFNVPSSAPAYGITTAPIAWWRADVLDADEGGPVASWPELTNHAPPLVTRVAATPPIFSSSVFAGGAVRFSAGACLVDTLFSLLSNRVSATVFFVYSKSTTGGTVAMFAPTSTGLRLVASGGSTITTAGAGSGSFSLDDTSKHIAEVAFDGEQASDAARLVVVSDGTAKTLSFIGSVPPALGGGVGLSVGASSNGTSPMSGDVAEILVLPGALSSVDRAAVRAALKARHSTV